MPVNRSESVALREVCSSFSSALDNDRSRDVMKLKSESILLAVAKSFRRLYAVGSRMPEHDARALCTLTHGREQV